MQSFVENLLPSVRATPRGVWVLVGGQFINRLGSFVIPFLALYLQHGGYSAGETSAVFAAFAAGGSLAPFFGGYLADAIGRRDTIVISLVGGAAGMLGIYASNNIAMLCIAAFAHSFLSHLFGPAASALLSDLVPPAKRQFSFSMLRLAVNAGFSFGPALGGLLFKFNPGFIFFGDASTTLVFALLAIRHLPHGLRTIGGNVTSVDVFMYGWAEAGRDAWRNRPFVRLYICMLLMTVAFMQVFNVLSLHAAAQGLDPVVYGVALGFNGVLVLFFELPVTHITQRYSPPRVLALGFVVLGLGCASFGPAHSLAEFLAAMALFTVGEMLTLPVALSYASTLAPEKYRGRYFGLLGTTWGLGGLTASVGPLFYSKLGATWWPLAGAFSIAGACLMFSPKPARQRASVHSAFPSGGSP